MSVISVRHFLKLVLELFLPFVSIWNNGENNKTEVKLPTLDGRFQAFETNILATDVNQVAFYLYPNASDLNYFEPLLFGSETSILKNSQYKVELPLILLIHGFVTNFKDEFPQTLKNAFLETNFLSNIVAVDWGSLSTPIAPTPYIYYNLAVDNVPRVANRTADFILFLLQIKALSSPASVHIIGFSLGAHVAGITGQNVNASIGKPIARITGLDPAAPAFQVNSAEQKLDKSDGAFVDVYHTNQGMKGYLGTLGHVDFFPNGGGPFQPGCSNFKEFSDVFTGTCSHGRAFMYFEKSIWNSSLMACKCHEKMVKLSAFPSTRSYVSSECKTTCLEPITFGQFCPLSAKGVYYIKIVP